MAMSSTICSVGGYWFETPEDKDGNQLVDSLARAGFKMLKTGSVEQTANGLRESSDGNQVTGRPTTHGARLTLSLL